MANPRKFSEKIALQKQKQAEETAEFEKIMKEVSDAAGKQDDFHCNQRTLENENKYSSSSNITVQKESRGRSAGVGPIRRLSDRKYERSPYSSGNVTYLSPPSESYWRRASSDSAINQSLIQSQNVDMTKVQHYHFIPGSTSQRPPPNSTNSEMETNHEMRNCSSATNIRHPSPECTLRLPSINAFPTHHGGLLSSPLHKNSGSLPDLTSVHFQSQVNNNNSHFNREIRLESGPYIKSQAEPYTVMLQLDPQQNKFQQSPTTTPPSHIEPQILTNSCQEINHQNFTMPEPKKTAHLSFTNLPSLVNHKVENSEPINIPAVSNHGSHGHLSSIGIAASNLTEYRVNRPSPGSTPGIMNITGDSHMSAPCSPIPQNPEDPYPNNNAAECSLSKSVQDHFKQFSLLDSCGDGSIKLDNRTQNPVMFEFDDSIGGHPSPASESNERPFDSDENEGPSSKKIGHVNDVKLYVNLDHSLGYPQEALKAASYQNPATPTSIPEIVFSDFSSINCDLSKELFGSLDLELGPVDSAGLQMLSDPDSTLIEDPTIEDSFRRDIS